jgi:UDP-GlcNAc:undecaprenyl-phosphate GlcNAc-1-phosphate transferase
VVLDAVLACAVAIALAAGLTPIVRAFARRFGLLAASRGERDLHDRPMPRLGGVAILGAVVVAGLIWLPGGETTRGILGGAVVITIVGAIDDIFDLPAWAKLIGQIVAAIIPVAAGVTIETVTVPFVGRVEFSAAVAHILPAVGIVAVMNMVNFIDGVDGLAAGVCTIAALTFGAIALSLDRSAAGMLAVIAGGAALGYLPYGFQPSSIFLGDSGSNLLGYLLAVVAIQGALKTNAVIALLFPLVILAVPILDSTFVVAKRIRYRKPIYKPDRWHLHHRLTNIGFSQRKTTLYLYAWTLSLAALALALRFVPYSEDGGRLVLGWSIVLGLFGLVALAASIYLVMVLEIVKLKSFRARQLRDFMVRRGVAPPGEHEVERGVIRELQTGEFQVTRIEQRPGRGGAPSGEATEQDTDPRETQPVEPPTG